MEVNNIIELYKKYNNYSKVERETGIDRKTVKKILIENGIDVKNIKQHKLNLSKEDVKNIIYMFKNNKSTEEISSMYDCDPSTILRILNNNGISTARQRDKCNFTKYNLNEHYFDIIDDEYKAYFLGFILADGCIYNNGLNITLQSRDKYMLEEFVKRIRSEHPVKKHYKYDTYVLDIKSSELTRRLREIGLCERKSYHIDFDKIIKNIPSNLMNHFVRGIFDGDGCIRKYKQTHYEKYFYHFSITGLENVVTWCKEYLNIDNKIIQDKRTKSLVTYYCLTRKKSNLESIFKILYSEANIYLIRKYEIFKEI